MAEIKVHSWHKEGPRFEVVDRKFNQRSFRNERTVVREEKQSGKKSKKPAWSIVEHGDDRWLLLNARHAYRVELRVGSVEDSLLVEDEKISVIPLEPGVVVKSVKWDEPDKESAE